jgi:ubiquinone/menaquinone biosynthesis C-methylase UbiE
MSDPSLNTLKYSIHTRLRQFHLEKLFPKGEEGSFLDVGCGIGYLSHFLGKGWKKYGVDTDHKALKLISDRDQQKVLLSNAIDIPFKNHSMDVILCSEVLEHLPDGKDQEALFEMARILKPGGHMFITVPSLEGLRSYSYLRNLGHDDPIGGEYHFRIGYSWKGLKEMIDEVKGVKIINKRYAMFLFSELFMDLLKWVYHKRNTIKEQSDLSDLKDSFLFRLYKLVFPLLYWMFILEDMTLATIFKGHVHIVALQKVGN